MDLSEAFAVLDLEPDATASQIRTAYRHLLRSHHPDLVGPQATEAAARLNEAYSMLSGREAEVTAEPENDPGPATGPIRDAQAQPGEQALVFPTAPGETYAHLFDAAARIGHIAYFDRHLGIIETVLRFPGGPSCSFVITVAPTSSGTVADFALESIEAKPAPPVGPVIEDLIRAMDHHG